MSSTKANSTVVEVNSNPPILVQVVWFIFVGWWAAQLWIVASWIMMATIIGLPIGIYMVGMVPLIIALRGRHSQERMIVHTPQGIRFAKSKVEQAPFGTRALYFAFVGWWLTLFWMEAAYLLCATFILAPIGVLMFDKAPMLLTLRKG